MKVDEPFARRFIEPGRSVATHRQCVRLYVRLSGRRI